MYNMSKRIGSTIKKFTIHRANGSVDVWEGPFHNAISGQLAQTNVLFHTSTDGGAFRTNHRMTVLTSPIRTLLDGTFSQSELTITRETGTGSLLINNGSILQFANGVTTYKKSGSSESTCVVMNPNTVTTQQLYALIFPDIGAVGPLSSTVEATTSVSYDSGIVTIVNETDFNNVITTGGTIKAFGIKAGVNTINAGYYYDLPQDLIVEVDDIVSIAPGDFVVTFTQDNHEPRVLPVCPLSGLTTSCRAQRLLPIWGINSYETADSPSRIYLIADGNEITLPNMAQTTITAPGVLTISETIIASNTSTTRSYDNQFTEISSVIGTVVTGLVNCKQIAWGSTSIVHGILEFDTPQNIEAGKVLTISTSRKTTPDLPPVPLL